MFSHNFAIMPKRCIEFDIEKPFLNFGSNSSGTLRINMMQSFLFNEDTKPFYKRCEEWSELLIEMATRLGFK